MGIYSYLKRQTLADKQERFDRLKKRFTEGPGDTDEKLKAGGLVGGLDDSILWRFLNAEKLDVDNAYARLQSYADWRADFIPKGRIEEEEVRNCAGEHLTWLLEHTDAHGRPLLVTVLRNHKPANVDLNEVLKWTVFAWEAAISLVDEERNPQGHVNSVFDMTGAGLSNMDLKEGAAANQLCERYYPERQGICWVYNPPTVFWALWTMLSPLMTKEMRSRIRFCYPGDKHIKLLLELYGVKALPGEVGGQADTWGLPVQDMVAKMRSK